MSKYAGLLQGHWAQHRPKEFAAMEDRNEFFRLTGAAVAAEVDAVAAAIAGPDVPGESQTEKARRLETARINAESDVLREVLPPVEDEDDEELSRDWLIDTSEWKKTQALSQAWDDAGSCGLPTEEETDALAEQIYARMCRSIDAELNERLIAIGEPPIEPSANPDA